MTGLVVIGGSYAGFNVAMSARQHGYAEPIRMLIDEPVLPYHRPPLSKGYLLGYVLRRLDIFPQASGVIRRGVMVRMDHTSNDRGASLEQVVDSCIQRCHCIHVCHHASGISGSRLQRRFSGGTHRYGAARGRKPAECSRCGHYADSICTRRAERQFDHRHSVQRAYSADVGRRFRLMPAIDSGTCRPGSPGWRDCGGW